MFGLHKDALAGTQLRERLRLASPDGADQALDWSVICDGQVRETFARRDDGADVPVEIAVTRMDAVALLSFCLGTMARISERRSGQAKSSSLQSAGSGLPFLS